MHRPGSCPVRRPCPRRRGRSSGDEQLIRAFVLNVPRSEAELAADRLSSCGVVAIEERSAPDDVIELWTSLGEDTAEIASSLTDDLPASWTYRFVEIDEQVAETWREFARPMTIEPGLVVCPAWIDYQAASGEVVVRIEPGSTFGMGDHPTTVLSMRALRRAVALRPGPVLDVGCGSGVLAVAACLFGAPSATAIDISTASPQVTKNNAVANGVGERVEASCAPLSSIDRRYPVVVANILAPVLIELSADLVGAVDVGGLLILSGLLADRYDHVAAAMTGFEVVNVDELDGWVALTMQRAASTS